MNAVAAAAPSTDTYEFNVIYVNGVGNSHNGGACCEPANNPDDPVDDVRIMPTLWHPRRRRRRFALGAGLPFPCRVLWNQVS